MTSSEHELIVARALADFLDLGITESAAVDREAFIRSFAQRHPALEGELRDQLDQLDSVGATLLDDVQARPPGLLPAVLSGVEVRSEIGAGAMGRVLLGHDPRLRRNVAIKLLGDRWQTNTRLRARFMEEARALARVSHPHVVRVYSLGQDHEPPHFVMEHIDGVPVTVAARSLPLTQKLELFGKIAAAVGFLHQQGLIHRDLKPANILTGADLEPKLLDFGLARQLDDGGNLQLTRDGEVLGTPLYFSPEQARGESEIDARSDVFSLGVLLYELLTGTVPFRAPNFREQVERICAADPVLPRRLDPAIPGDVQNICLKALEKNAAERYVNASELARDVARFLAGDSVAARPPSYLRLISSQVQRHLDDIELWRSDHVITSAEYEQFRRAYDHLFEREDAWLMEFRRLSLPHVLLYLGAWILTVAAVLLVLFRYAGLPDGGALMAAAVASGVAGFAGVRDWNRGALRSAIAWLLAFTLLLPCAWLVAMHAFGWFTGFSLGRRDLEFLLQFKDFQPSTNAQLWWAFALTLPAILWLRWHTRASVFSLVSATFGALLALITLLRMGLLDWISADPGRAYAHLLPVAAVFLIAGAVIERRSAAPDSRYFYFFATVFLLAALSGIAWYSEGYAHWLGRTAGWTRGKIEYLFMLNALYYSLLYAASERFAMPRMTSAARVFRFVVPGHVLGSLLFLGLDANSPVESKVFQVLLPAASLAFVLLAIPRQMKNFLASGLVFLAIGIVRLQQNWLKDVAIWPLALLAAGIALLFFSAHPKEYSLVTAILGRSRR